MCEPSREADTCREVYVDIFRQDCCSNSRMSESWGWLTVMARRAKALLAVLATCALDRRRVLERPRLRSLGTGSSMARQTLDPA
jgi:hypothetical protein